jgi:DNA-binding transcriptional regulator LsrR (DeoR family)
MPDVITADQVVDAAKGLDQEEFTREDVAQKLGVEKSDVKRGFNVARKSGQIEKTRDDEENTGHFRVAGQ